MGAVEISDFGFRIANLGQRKVKYSYPMSQAWKRYDLTPLTGYCWLGKKKSCGRRPGWSRAGAFHFSEEPLARMFHELLWRDREDGRATGQPQGVGSEAYLNGTSQGTTPEDAREDGYIHGCSRRFMKHPGYYCRSRHRNREKMRF